VCHRRARGAPHTSTLGLMDILAHHLTKISLWGLPLLWLAFSWLTWVRHSWVVGACFLVAGLSGTLWNFLFLPVVGNRPSEIWRAVIFVDYDDAPLGHILSVYLPLLSKVCLVAAIALLVIKREA